MINFERINSAKNFESPKKKEFEIISHRNYMN